MLVIADSGATKTQWLLVHADGNVVPFETIGLNPYFCQKEDYIAALGGAFQFNPANVQEVFFYGAGCAASERSQLASNALAIFFNRANVYVYSDILGAARALFGSGEGIAIILGTGTNVGYYNGTDVLHATPSLGYALGDEGSGAYIGRELVRQWLYKELPASIMEQMEQRFQLSLHDVLQRVYTEPFPGRFLASFVPFVAELADEPSMDAIVCNAFNELFLRHVAKYPNYISAEIGVVGSVGVVFHEKLNRVFESHGTTIKAYLKYPIDKLLNYHSIGG